MSDLLTQLTTFLAYLNVPAKLDRVLANQEATMAAIDDLKAIVTQISADIAAVLAALAAAQTSGDDAAVEEQVANLKALSLQLEASVAPKGPTP